MLLRARRSRWMERARFPTYGSRSRQLRASTRVGADGQVYAAAHGDAAHSKAVYRLDLATGKTDAEPLLSAKGFDIEPRTGRGHRTHKVVLGAHYETDAGGDAPGSIPT